MKVNDMTSGSAPERQDGTGQDLSAFWMPFTDNRYFKANPRLFASARDMHYVTPEGRPVLDGTSGLWCVNAGHCREPIVAAIREAAATLDFAPTFQLGHPKAYELAERLAEIMPAGLDRVFFTNSGSESADTSLKIALAYHKARGEGQRVRLIGRARGYHGTNFGGMSVGGIPGNRRAFGAQLWGVDHLPHTQQGALPFTRGAPAPNENLAGELQTIIDLHGADTIAAVIVEPVAGSAGVLVPPSGYLRELRELTRRHGILLIFDEVITGFGRLGRATAAEYFAVVPDILNTAKGLTNGSVPMGAVAASREIYDTIVGNALPGIEFPHGYTYSGHPLAAAAGLASLKLYADDGLFERASSLATLFEDAVHGLALSRLVCDVRNIGLMAGIELEVRPGRPGERAREVFHRCFDAGVLIRVTGDIIALSPPLIVSEAQIDEIVSTIGQVLAGLD